MIMGPVLLSFTDQFVHVVSINPDKVLFSIKIFDIFLFLHENVCYRFWLCLTTRQPLWVILCRLPEKGRKETEEIAEEMKERDREERGTGMKVKKQKK